MTDYTIIGTPKCGSSSLYYYLKKLHPNSNIRKFESFYSPTARLEFDAEYAGSVPLIIIRKQADRLNSFYWYAEMYERATFREWLEGDWPAYFRFGGGKPLEQCNWMDAASQFSDLQPRIYRLEEIQEDPNFPKHNMDKSSRKYQPLSEEDRKFINGKLEEMGLDEYGFQKRKP